MMKVRKKLFTLSGLFMVLAQVFVAAFCGITAVAITKDETRKTLFDTTHAVATMAYEETAENRLKWSISLEKKGSELPTKFNVQLLGNTGSVTPDNLLVTNENGSAIYLSGGDGTATSSIYEEGASTTGKVLVTFETENNLEKLTVKPQLMTTEANVVDLLKQGAETVFELPIVEQTKDSLVTTETSLSEVPVHSSADEILQETTSSSSVIEQSSSVEYVVSAPAAVLANGILPLAKVEDSNTLPGKNELVIRSDYDNAIADVTVEVKGTHTSYPKERKTPSDQVDYASLEHYKEKVYSKYGSVNGACAVILEKDKVSGVEIKVTYKRVGTYNGQDVGAVLIISNIQQADSSSWTRLNQPVIDFASCLYSGIVYDYIKGMDVSISFIDTNNKAIEMDHGKSFMTFASLNSSQHNDNHGAEYVFPNFDTTAYRTTGTAIGKGKPADSIKNTYPYGNQEAYYGVKIFGDSLMDPDYINGAVSFNLNGGTGGSEFTLGSLASRAWTSFMSSVLVPIDPGNPTKTVTEATTFDDRTNDELDILKEEQKNQTLNDNNITQHSYFINQPLYNADESIARPKTIQLIDTLPKYVKPTKITLLQTGDYSRILTEGDKSSRIKNINDDGCYEINFELDAEEMNEIIFRSEGISWRIDVEVDEAYTAANQKNSPIIMENQANVVFVIGGTESFGHETNKVATKVVPELQDITVEKRWKNDEGFTSLRQDIVLQLQAKLVTETKWTNVPDQSFEISKDATSDALRHTFVNLPRKEEGTAIDYRVIELVGGQQVAVTGYKDPVYSSDTDSGNLIVTNELKKFDFRFTKTGVNNAPLEGAKFSISGGGLTEEYSSISDGQGNVNFNSLPINPTDNPYILTEVFTPKGYQLGQDGKNTWKFNIVESGSSLNLVWVDGNPLVDGKFNNQLKDFDLTVNKEDDLEGKLKGAVFTLTGNGVNQQVPKTDDPETDTFTFNNLKPGTYQLTETKSPDGFVGLRESITIIISTQGDVTVSGYEVTNDPTQTESESGLPLAVAIKTTGSDNNTISFSVINKKKVPLPSTGGSGTMFFVTVGVLGLLSTALYFLQRKDQEVA